MPKKPSAIARIALNFNSKQRLSLVLKTTCTFNYSSTLLEFVNHFHHRISSPQYCIFCKSELTKVRGPIAYRSLYSKVGELVPFSPMVIVLMT